MTPIRAVRGSSAWPGCGPASRSASIDVGLRDARRRSSAARCSQARGRSPGRRTRSARASGRCPGRARSGRRGPASRSRQTASMRCVSDGCCFAAAVVIDLAPERVEPEAETARRADPPEQAEVVAEALVEVADTHLVHARPRRHRARATISNTESRPRRASGGPSPRRSRVWARAAARSTRRSAGIIGNVPTPSSPSTPARMPVPTDARRISRGHLVGDRRSDRSAETDRVADADVVAAAGDDIDTAAAGDQSRGPDVPADAVDVTSTTCAAGRHGTRCHSAAARSPVVEDEVVAHRERVCPDLGQRLRAIRSRWRSPARGRATQYVVRSLTRCSWMSVRPRSAAGMSP